MNISTPGLLGLAFLIIFALLIIGLTVLAGRRGRRPPTFRFIEAFASLPRQVGESVETGKRLHISLGPGGVGGADTAATLAGLTILERLAQAATVSDKPPVVTAGEGATMILAQDTLRRAYNRLHAEAHYDPNASRLAGATPLSFAAGAMMTIPDESAATNILTGPFGNEVALIAEVGSRAGLTQLGGAEDPQAQALIYAATEHPLVGEELYVGGAYLAGLPAHRASLRAQDAMRWLVVLAILLGVAAKTLGLL